MSREDLENLGEVKEHDENILYESKGNKNE